MSIDISIDFHCLNPYPMAMLRLPPERRREVPGSLLCAGCRDRAWCLRHSAVESPLLKFTTVNINETSSRLHSAQYVYRFFWENRIPSNTSIDIFVDFHCFRLLGPPDPESAGAPKTLFSMKKRGPGQKYLFQPNMLFNPCYGLYIYRYK